MFRWHISFEHHFYKSKRDEYLIRLWREVKYRPPHNVKISTTIAQEGVGVVSQTTQEIFPGVTEAK